MGIIVDADPLTIIDRVESQGLTGVSGSLGYHVEEIDRHVHSWEHWCEAAAVPVGETHICDVMSLGTPFVIDAGNDDWGAWVQMIGSSDTPILAGKVKFDMHRLFITAAERTSLYIIQLAFGASGAAALAANTYSTIPFKPAGPTADETPLETHVRRVDVGTKVWARCKNPGQNTATLDFFHGSHEYEG
jgi:hypothetical protein